MIMFHLNKSSRTAAVEIGEVATGSSVCQVMAVIKEKNIGSRTICRFLRVVYISYYINMYNAHCTLYNVQCTLYIMNRQFKSFTVYRILVLYIYVIPYILIHLWIEIHNIMLYFCS